MNYLFKYNVNSGISAAYYLVEELMLLRHQPTKNRTFLIGFIVILPKGFLQIDIQKEQLNNMDNNRMANKKIIEKKFLSITFFFFFFKVTLKSG